MHTEFMQLLNAILTRDGATVVVTSTLRYGRTVAELQVMLESQGFTGRVVDKTPTGTPGAARGEEIAVLLAENAVDGYVIIDDHADMGELRTHLVQTDSAHRLRPADAPHPITMLMRPLNGRKPFCSS